MLQKLGRNMKNTEKTQIGLLQMKTTMSDIKNILDGINNRLHIVED